MRNLTIFSEKERQHLLMKRKGESKFGEHIQLLPNVDHIYDGIVNLDVDYVIFGISESVGVYGNQGNSGTQRAWDAVLKILLNIQSNRHTKASRVLILGHLSYPEMQENLESHNLLKKKSIKKARLFTEIIDKDVTYLVSTIVKAGKKPIIIGGGHNNAFGIIKGNALAANSKVNVVNFDAHSDFRSEEGRHSGNGFSYAFAEGFLRNYFIFGLHENYTSDSIFLKLNKVKNLKYNTYEAMEIREELKFKTELDVALEHVSSDTFGIEIDCDAIADIPSSAMSPSGFSVKKARQFVHYFGKHKNANYLHICEAAPTEATDVKVGKLITYLITDFIRAHDH